MALLARLLSIEPSSCLNFAGYRVADNIEFNMPPKYGASFLITLKIPIICDAGSV